MPRGVYQRTKPTGFLHPQNEHVVHVIGIGSVYQGRNAREAHRAFARWVKFAGEPIGRASGKTVVHMINGRITKKQLSITKNILKGTP